MVKCSDCSFCPITFILIVTWPTITVCIGLGHNLTLLHYHDDLIICSIPLLRTWNCTLPSDVFLKPGPTSLHLFVAQSQSLSFSHVSHSLNPRLHETTLAREIKSKWILESGISFSLCSIRLLLPLFPLWFSPLKAKQSDCFHIDWHCTRSSSCRKR